MEKELPYYDERGNELEEEDLLQVYHFTGVRKRIHYMYQVVTLEEYDGKLWWRARDWDTDKSHYWLRSIAHKVTRKLKGYRTIDKKDKLKQWKK